MSTENREKERQHAMKATVLIDNIGNDGLTGEWGLSFYIEYKEKKFLLDAGGASGLFAENAGKLSLSLADVDYAVLSHAHYDHADGMTAFFGKNHKAKLYLQESCGENCWRVKEDHMKYIGIRRGMLEEYRDRLFRVRGDMEICAGARLIGHHTPGLAEAGKREKMFLKNGEAWVTDCFDHEQSLVFEEEDGIVIFNSCCHGGADNIIREAADVYPGRRILAAIGGFHLHNKDDGFIRELAGRMRGTGVEQIYTGHCTGENGYRVLRSELGSKVHQLQAGMEIIL